MCWAGTGPQLTSQGVQGSRTGGLTLVSGGQEKGGVSGDGEGLEDSTHSLENSLEQGWEQAGHWPHRVHRLCG